MRHSSFLKKPQMTTCKALQPRVPVAKQSFKKPKGPVCEISPERALAACGYIYL
jgi:hypothetical protein